jgi:hypothetical protein
MSQIGNLLTKAKFAYDIEAVISSLVLDLTKFPLNNYLNEDSDLIKSSISILTSSLITEISEVCISDKVALSQLISFVKNFDPKIISSSESNIIELDLTKTLNRLSDNGTSFLKQVFQDNLGKVVSKISTKSKLKDESDFTLLAIIATKFLIYLKSTLVDEQSDTFSFLEIFKSALGLEINLDSIQQEDEKKLTIVENISVLRPVLGYRDYLKLVIVILPLIVVIFSIFDFFYKYNETGSLSAFTVHIPTNQSELVDSGFGKFKNKVINFFKLYESKDLKDKIIGDEDISTEINSQIKDLNDLKAKISFIKETYQEDSIEGQIGIFLFSEKKLKASFFLSKIIQNSLKNEFTIEDKKIFSNISIIVADAIKAGVLIEEIILTENLYKDIVKSNKSSEHVLALKKELIYSGVSPSKVFLRSNVKDLKDSEKVILKKVPWIEISISKSVN